MKISANRKLFYPLLAALLLFCAACNQDPIFHIISQEIKPRPPRVPGTPTAMVLFEREYPADSGERVPVVYIASAATLYWYARPDKQDDVNPTDQYWEKQKGDKWWNTAKGKVRQPGGTGRILGLAATDNYLYALYQKQLKRIKSDSEPNAPWEDVPNAANEQISFDTIFSSNNRIFIGGLLPQKDKSIPCAILYVDGDDKIQLLKDNTHLLKGVAFNGASHFLCVNNLYANGGSIFKLNDSSFSSPPPADLADTKNSADATKSNLPFTGIISLEDGVGTSTIIAMDRPGILYTINDTDNTFTSTGKNIGRSTGGLALWRDPQSPEWDANDLSKKPRPKLLLAGYQGELILTTSTGYTNGYFEFELKWNQDGTLDITSDFIGPGKSDGSTTIDNNERYLSTIGKYPINSFFQTPKDIDENMTLFASTVNEGLWSYRGRDRLTQWNAEE